MKTLLTQLSHLVDGIEILSVSEDGASLKVHNEYLELKFADKNLSRETLLQAFETLSAGLDECARHGGDVEEFLADFNGKYKSEFQVSKTQDQL